MAATFQVIALSSIDPEGQDTRAEPELYYPDALKAAKALKAQGKAFRVFAKGAYTDQEMQSFRDIGALV
jgi:hypothetical protein